MLRRKILLIILSIFLFVALVNAQTPEVLFKHLSLKEGFTQSPVFSLLQDKQGFIWIGSREGLIRFDGYAFKKFVSKEPLKRPIIHNDIRALYEDLNGNLWVGTTGGLLLFDRRTELFTLADPPDAPAIHAIQADDHGKLWIATTIGLECIDIQTRKKVGLASTPVFTQLKNRNINTLFLDKQKNLWIGLDTGLLCINISSQKIVPLPDAIRKNELLSDSRVFVIKEDLDGDFWFGTENNGLFRYNHTSNTCMDYPGDNKDGGLPSNFVRDILVYDAAKIWIGTRDGLSILDKNTNTFTNYRHESSDPGSLSHSPVWSFMRDDAGNIWLATYAGGINIYNVANTNFRNIGERIGNTVGLNEPLVNAVLPDQRGNIIWAGTDGGGLNRIDRVSKTAKYYPVRSGKKLSNVIKSMTWDRDGQLVLGTLEGIAFFNPQNESLSYFDFYREKKTRNIRINALFADETGIWAGTEFDGLQHITDHQQYESFTSSADTNSISDNYINAITADQQGNLWIATRNGLSFFNKEKKRFSRFYLKDNPNNNVILSLYVDSRQMLWVGTRNGIYYFSQKTNRFYRLATAGQNGLANPTIQGITEDDAGRLWVSTSFGLSGILLRNIALPFTDSSYKIVNYNSDDGLTSNQFLLGAVSKRGSELFFGGVNGIAAFYPGKIIKNEHQPNVVITDLLIHNKSVKPATENSPLSLPIEETKKIVLNYDQGYITFTFAALNFINSQNNQYAYKLEGLGDNEEWHYAGNQRIANYTNLEPGNYIFRLKASNNDGIWSSQITSINITILPPVWKTWWAYSLYVILFISFMYVIVRFFRGRAKLERDLYYEHLQNVRQQEVHQMKLDLFTNISHEIRTPLTLISGPLEDLIRKSSGDAAMKQQLGVMKNNSDRLMRLISELLDFRKVETGHMQLYISRYNVVPFLKNIFASFQDMAAGLEIDYRFKAMENDIRLFFDEQQLEKVVFNLLANAFKFTPEKGSIELNVFRTTNEVQFSITNNGKGIPLEKQARLFTNFYQAHEHNSRNIGSGIGLALSKSIVELHQGTIAVESEPAGLDTPGRTCFTVSLKTGYSHFHTNQLINTGISENVVVSSSTAPVAMPEAAVNDVGCTEKEYTLLVVEDNDEVRNFIESSLSEKYKIRTSSNGNEGWVMAIEIIPDLIISDVMMPEMNGFELGTKLKSDERTSHIPVILLTARAAQEHHIHGLETGADLYLVKPFSIQVLELHIRNLLASRDKLRHKFSQLIKLEPTQKIIDLPDERFLRKVLVFIEENLDNPEFGVPMLASEACMSQPVLYKKIKALTDLSVNDFIKTIRLKKAAQLLEQKQFTVYEVAYAVGYNDSKYFSKEFSKQFGKTPTAYVNSLEDIT